jgi:polyvinyl alcohol dehydrogenase (cytochrome)
MFLLPAWSYAEDWSMYLRDVRHSSFNSVEALLTHADVGRLKPAWTLPLHANLAAAVTQSAGVLYLGAWDGNFYAVDARDGQVLWTHFVGIAPDPGDDDCQPGIGVTSQAVVIDDIVYVGGGDSTVYALNKNTGKPLWSLPLADPGSGSYLWSSLTPYNNSLYIGVSSLGDCPLVRGALVRIDLSGPAKSLPARPLIHYLAPKGVLGGGIWSTPAIDPATDTVFVTTGTGDQDETTGLWGGTMLALDATTLEVKSHYFLPTNSLDLDIEWGSSPTLFTTHDGVPMVAASGKDGILYGLRRGDLSLAWKIELAVQCICPECGCGALSTPAFDGNTLYAGAGSSDPGIKGSVSAINPATGALLWKQPLDGIVIAPVTVANQLVFVSTTKGLKILDTATGHPLWDDGHRGTVYSQPVVVDGAVFSTYFNGDLVAWRPK